MLSPSQLDPIIDAALREDLHGGDITTEATVDSPTRARGLAHARTPLVSCGSEVFSRVFSRLDPSIVFTEYHPDGTRVPTGSLLWSVEGSAASLLKGERTALNFVQRMAGIATLTHAYVSALPQNSKTRITDSRKTTPGLRLLERHAVRTGGGHNHRNDLSSAVLIKDNHIVAAGGIEAAIRKARDYAPHTSKIELEVDTLEQLDEALRCGADIIMLDNFTTDRVVEAVRRTAGRAILEVSGGVTLARIPEIASTGIDVISVGALTHSAPSADIGLELELVAS